MCVCVCVCVTHVCICVCMCVCDNECVCLCLFVCWYVCVYVSVRMCFSMHSCVFVCEVCMCTVLRLQSLCCVLYSCKGVKIHGVTYKQGSVIRMSNDEEGDLPFVYAQIVHVYVYQDFKIFITNNLSIIDFVSNLRAISVNVTSNSLVCLSTQLYSHGVLHIKQHAHISYLVEKDHWAKHTLFY